MVFHGNSICHRETENSLSDVISYTFQNGQRYLRKQPLINYSTIQRGTKLKLPRPAKNLISSFPINFINTRVGEKRGQIMRKGAFHFLLDLK